MFFVLSGRPVFRNQHGQGAGSGRLRLLPRGTCRTSHVQQPRKNRSDPRDQRQGASRTSSPTPNTDMHGWRLAIPIPSNSRGRRPASSAASRSRSSNRSAVCRRRSTTKGASEPLQSGGRSLGPASANSRVTNEGYARDSLGRRQVSRGPLSRAGPACCGVRRCRGTGSGTGLASPTVGAGSQAVQDTIGSTLDGADLAGRTLTAVARPKTDLKGGPG